MTIQYDDTNIDAIVEYAHNLVGHTLREMTDVSSIDNPRKRRGSFGNAVEERYFGLPLNSRSEPDFTKVGLELKTTPLKRLKSGRIVSKERLVLANMNYMDIVSETFETSHLMHKVKQVLLISYLWEQDADPLDYVIYLADLWSFPPEDLPQIKQDWETVVRKVRDGHAEDISSSDTLYLEACTKAADGSRRKPQPFSSVKAKPRAWALKASYMTAVSAQMLSKRAHIPRSEDEKRLTLLELIRERFSPYYGMTKEELALRFACNPNAKHITALISNKILGVSTEEKIDEFEKAGIKPKAIRIRRNGVPKESMSFPAMDFFKVAKTSFENSDFYLQVTQRYLFVIYREDENGLYRLSDVLLWQIPDDDIEQAKHCYEQMQANIRNGRADVSVHSTENPVCHVRTHGRNAQDKSPQPFGSPVPKRSFWFNASYLAKQIESNLGS